MAFKAAVCGLTRQEAHKVSTQVSAGAASCGKINRGCDWDLQPGTRGLFLHDWWFLSSSELADGFGGIWAGFENMTAVIKTELVTEQKRLAASKPASSPFGGIWLFGHLFWGLQILRTLKSRVEWARLSVGIDYTLARMAQTAPVKCWPTAAQVANGALSQAGTPVQVPRAFSPVEKGAGANEAINGDTTLPPSFTDEAKHVVPDGVSPLVHACRIPAFGTGRAFKCPGTSAACKGRRVADPGGTAATAGRFLEATKKLGHVLGCQPSGAYSIGGHACARALAALWGCMRLASSSENCSKLLSPRSARTVHVQPPTKMRRILPNASLP